MLAVDSRTQSTHEHLDVAVAESRENKNGKDILTFWRSHMNGNELVVFITI